ncbi:MAG: hypothetical protein JNL87_04270 [Burkholderiaceae bacterium]|nr:hypothetical protein [Burkholderiaceae bacterium]
MLKSLRRMLARGPALPETSALQQWADVRGHGYRRVRDAEGCVIDGKLGTQAWRIEWGASQRDYITGFELRLMAELALPPQLLAMVLNRSLLETMERTVYERFVDDVQTRIDTDTPPEMRWLVMYRQAGAQDLGPLRERYGAVCSISPWLQQWLAGPLNDALAATVDRVAADQPVVLTIGRGRLMLRTAMAQPDAGALAAWFSVFEHGLREARRLGQEWRAASAGGLTTQPSAWSNSELVPTSVP